MRRFDIGPGWRLGILAVVGALASTALALSPASASASDCVAAPAGLVAWWPADSDAVDIVGTSNGALMNGAGFDAAGKAGAAFSFDGVDDAVQVPDSDLWALSGDFTIDVWANFASVPSTPDEEAAVLVGNDEGSGDLDKWFFALTWDNQLSFHINGPAPGSHWLVNAPFTPKLGQWYHLAITRSGDTYTVYVDGVAAGSEASSVVIPNPDAPLTIGRAEALPTDGLIDEIEIFDRALGLGEIAAIHDADSAGKCKPNAHPVGLVDPSQGMWYLRHSASAIRSFFYGNPGDVPFMGDWDCNGTSTPGLFRTSDAFAYLRNSNTQGIADIRFFFGNPSDIPLAGDFNGDGCDTLSIYRPSEARFYIINKLGENEGGLGAAEYSFLFGNPGDKPVVGDWDGDGIDEIGLHRETTGFFYYRNTLTTGIADGQFYFGDPGDRFVAGDWGVVDGVETPAMFRPSNSTFYFRHTLTQGIADSQFVWAGAGSNWLPVSGDFTLD